MGFVDVEFDGEALPRPVDVQLVPADGDVGGWHRQARSAHPLEEAALEPGTEDIWWPVDPEGTAQTTSSRMAGVPCEHSLDRTEVEQPALLAAVKGTLEVVAGNRGCKVQIGPRKGGNRDVVEDISILRGEVASVMQPDRRSGPARPRPGDFKRRRASPGDLPQPRSGGVTEQSAGTAGEHSGEAHARFRDMGVTNRVDASVEAMQSATRRSPLHGALRVAEWPQQLANRHHAVLSFGQLGQSVMPYFAPCLSR
jgi:hypothetical protein